MRGSRVCIYNNFCFDLVSIVPPISCYNDVGNLSLKFKPSMNCQFSPRKIACRIDQVATIK